MYVKYILNGIVFYCFAFTLRKSNNIFSNKEMVFIRIYIKE